MGYDCFKLGVQIFLLTFMLVHDLRRKFAYKTFNISFESTQRKQHYGTKITCTEVRKEVMVIRNEIQVFSGSFVGLSSNPPLDAIINAVRLILYILCMM